MLLRVSPWAAVRKRNTSRSLRKAMPNVAPAPGDELDGAIRLALLWVNGIVRSGVKLPMPPEDVPTTMGPELGVVLSRMVFTMIGAGAEEEVLPLVLLLPPRLPL